MKHERIVMTKNTRDKFVSALRRDGIGEENAYDIASALMHLLNRNGIRATKKFLEDACQTDIDALPPTVAVERSMRKQGERVT